MSKITDFFGFDGFKPFNDLGTVTGSVDIDLTQYSAFRVKQGLGNLNLNFITDSDSASNCDLFIYDRANQYDLTFANAVGVLGGYKPTATPDPTYAGANTSIPSIPAGSTMIDCYATSLKFYIGYQNDGGTHEIRQYSYGGAGNATSLTYDSVSLQLTDVSIGFSSFIFSSGGLKLYVLRYSGEIYEYTLSTSFDLTTASFVGSINNISEINIASEINISDDGTKIYVAEDLDSVLSQYTLSTPYSISTLNGPTPDATLNLNSNNSHFFFNPQGRMLYEINDKVVIQYYLTSPFELSGANEVRAVDLGNSPVPNGIMIRATADASIVTICYTNPEELYVHDIQENLEISKLLTKPQYISDGATLYTEEINYEMRDQL